MSVIFGICAPCDSIVDERTLLGFAGATERYGRDETALSIRGRIGMGFQAFHTHVRSRLERQPVVDPAGNMLVFDGRLDNYQELAARLGVDARATPDSELALEAFGKWGEGCFSCLIGDWSLALWSARDNTLRLARDHAGSRSLFYRIHGGQIRWSSYLEPFFVDGTFPEADRGFLARFLAYQQANELTPFRGIGAVPAAHFLAIREGSTRLRPHWRPLAVARIAGRSNREYEERFVELFQQAVRRRTGSGCRILAELSGGMDSSSIICMADKTAGEDGSPQPQLDTVSYFDDSEPDWDERPYFEAVERFRNKKGIHIDRSRQIPIFQPLILPDRVYPYPGVDCASLDDAIRFEQRLGDGQYRVLLSGIGGDELLGGVPTPLPELANHLRSGRFQRLLSSASRWCLLSRRPILSLLFETVVYTAGLYGVAPPAGDQAPSWLNRRVLSDAGGAAHTHPAARDLFRALPSAIAGTRAWWKLIETLPHFYPQLVGHYEYRYPYLDRDLVEFLLAIPREQLVQPGRRRFLMRRALKTIVPDEILERKRKAFVWRAPLMNLLRARERIEELFTNPMLAEFGLIDREVFLGEFRRELAGERKWIGHLIRTISMEVWLKSLAAQRERFCAAGAVENSGRAILPAVMRVNKLRAGVASFGSAGAEICNKERSKSCSTQNPIF